MSQSIQLRARVQGNNLDEIMANTLTLWRRFTGKEDASLPWGVDYTVADTESLSDILHSDGEPAFTADVIINAATSQD